jgi:arabinofuranosyltransferase
LGGSILLGLAELTRPEGLLLGLIGIAAFCVLRARDRTLTRSVALQVALPFAVLVITHFVWRRAYYGDWLPNTYYAKHVRAWWDTSFGGTPFKH